MGEVDLALVVYENRPCAVELRELPVPRPSADEVLVEVRAVGVCGSDLHMWQAVQSWSMRYPVVLGHEFAGVIAAVGAGVTKWRVGDRVVSETHAVIDPDSPLTRHGLYNLDPGRKGFGTIVDGAMRRRIAVPQRILHRVPDNVPFEHACLAEPCSVAYNAVVNNVRIRPGDRVLVIGPGPVGILCGAVARLCGAVVGIAGIEADRARLKVAEGYGLTPLLDGVPEWCRQGDGYGVEGVVDAAGVSATLRLAMQVVRPNGWISKVGWGPQPLDCSLDPLVQKNVTLQGSFSHNWPVWERVLALMASEQLNVAPIIGGVWKLAQWQEAFEAMHAGRIVKAVLRP